MSESVGVNPGGAVEAAPAPVPAREQAGAAGENNGGEWTAGLSAENLELVGKYGYKSLDDVVGRIRQIESVAGEDGLRSVLLPKDDAGDEAWNDLYGKLGRPEKAADYGLNAVLANAEMTPMDDAFLGNMSEAMHKAGLNTRQAQALTRACNEQFQALAESLTERYEEALAEAREKFPPQTIEKARRALSAAGLDAQARADVERALGPARAIEIFSKASAALLPDAMPEGAAGPSFTGTPESAKARMDSLFRDQAFVAAYMRGDESALSTIENLSKRATQG